MTNNNNKNQSVKTNQKAKNKNKTKWSTTTKNNKELEEMLNGIFAADKVDPLKDVIFGCTGAPSKMPDQSEFRRLITRHFIGYLETGSTHAKVEFATQYIVNGITKNGGRFFKLDLKKTQPKTKALVIRQLLPANQTDHKLMMARIMGFLRDEAYRFKFGIGKAKNTPTTNNASSSEHDQDESSASLVNQMDIEDDVVVTKTVVPFSPGPSSSSFDKNKNTTNDDKQEPEHHDLTTTSTSSNASRTSSETEKAANHHKTKPSPPEAVPKEIVMAESSTVSKTATTTARPKSDLQEPKAASLVQGAVSTRKENCMSPLAMDCSATDDNVILEKDFLPPPSTLQFTESMAGHSLGTILCDDHDTDAPPTGNKDKWWPQTNATDLLADDDIIVPPQTAQQMQHALECYHSFWAHDLMNGSRRGVQSFDSLAKHLRSVVHSSSELLRRVEVLCRMEQEQTKLAKDRPANLVVEGKGHSLLLEKEDVATGMVKKTGGMTAPSGLRGMV
ncbi:expressed unknown protein [Seminavis robusta]|uniref:Uncharacterized protein n=1 Tax=Seminavis robusta TaxID=568900 RepID=A0A9N8DVT0_9STRA|nr:expressed unknown protein [Seminavis robusta]|eukprot:Sro319_g116210.1 n/a (503) ;mRNA; r:24477-25985